MLLCMLCCLSTVLTYTEKIIKMFGGASLSHCMHVVACVDMWPWILHTRFWWEGSLNISNHLPDSSFT